MKKTYLVIGGIIIIFVCLVVFGGGAILAISMLKNKAEEKISNVIPTEMLEVTPGLANPAATFCEENGGKSEIRETTVGQTGYCTFAAGSECEEWAFYRGECLVPSTTSNPTKSSPSTAVVTDLPKATIDVYLFDQKKFNQSDNPNSDYVTKVTRTTTRKDIAAFAVEEIIKGPSAAEINQGLGQTFKKDSFTWFTGNSNCSGNDFTISINSGKATVKFCRSTTLSGDMSGFIVEQQIVKTLKQFPTIQSVRILNVAGDCYNDMKGVGAEECYE
ncbi:MAG: DUF333 domain-containing protein [bacterium]